MKISISNIAWEYEENSEIIEILQQHEIEGIDVAPTKWWENPLESTEEQIDAEKKKWTENGFSIPGMQSIHYGYDGLHLFESEESRSRMLNHTKQMIELAGKIGVAAIVFGSPKNRQRGALSIEEAMDIAIPFFKELGEHALLHNTAVCIEPNATDYGCDFVTTSAEGIDIVTAVDSEGFKLHLDMGTMQLMGEDIASAITQAAPYMKHFHVSSPWLEQVGTPESESVHRVAAEALHSIAYAGWVSIEMKNGLQEKNTTAVTTAVSFTKQLYGNA